MLARCFLGALLFLTPAATGAGSGQARLERSAFRVLTAPTSGDIQVHGVPLGESERTLVLTSFDVFAGDVWIDVHTERGRVRGSRPTARYYRGVVLGDPGSHAFVSIDDDIRGLVVLGGGVFSVGPETELSGSGNGALVVREVDPEQMLSGQMTCGGARWRGGNRAQPESRQLASSIVYDIRVAVETDNELYVKLGSRATMLSYVGNLIGAASAIYNRDVRANLVVGYVGVWETPSDPWNSTDKGDALTELGNYWHFNRSSVSRSLVHMIRGEGPGGGIANAGVLCEPDVDVGNPGQEVWAGAYSLTNGVSGTSGGAVDPSYLAAVLNVAHEIGHVCGSDHTNCYNPPIDMCRSGEAPYCYNGPVSFPEGGGTIMSACSPRKLVLGEPGSPSQAVNELIRSRIEAKAGTSCLTVAAPCSSTVTPAMATYGPNGGSGAVTVGGDASCPWTATSSASFITFTGNNLGTGPATVSYQVAPNTGTVRTGTLTVAGKTVAITQTACATGGRTLCLSGSRFKVTVSWTNPYATPPTSGVGTASTLTSDTGAFWFFEPSNIELVVKVLDGRGTNGKFWVFYGALSDVAYTITITDTETGAVKTYANPAKHLGSVADTSAFDGL